MTSIYGLTKNVFSSPLINAPKVLLMGTCQIDYLVDTWRQRGHEIDFYFYFSKPFSDLSAINNIKDYQAGIVALTFSNFFEQADLSNMFLLVRNWNEEKANRLFEQFTENLPHVIEKISSLTQYMPVFIPSFVDESFNSQGMFKNFYADDDISDFIYRLNKFLATTLKHYPQMYLIDMPKILNQVSVHGLRDDILLPSAHFSWLQDGTDHLEKNRLAQVDVAIVQFDTARKIQALSLVFWDYMEIMFKSLDKTLEKIKLIITDLDGTLWRGVAAEEELNVFEHMFGWPTGYAEALIGFKSRGGLLAICSKNDEAPTLDRLDNMFFRQFTRHEFVSIKINWQTKSENIRAILQEVNLRPENVLFIDDNPREIDEVLSAFPTIKTLSQNHYLWRATILTAPEMQFTHISTESKHRTELIKANLITKNSQSQFSTKEDWLRSLQLEQKFGYIHSNHHPDFERAFELINKTNQFNTNGKRWTLAEILSFFENGGYAISMFLKDRTVDNGLVGVALIQQNSIVQMVMSCRVFELGAEQGFMRYIMQMLLADHSCATVELVNTGKNTVCLSFFEIIGFYQKNDKWLSHTLPVALDWINPITAEKQ